MDGMILGILIAAISLISVIIQANESRKKKEKERRRKETDTKAVSDVGAGRKPTLTQILEELAREASGGDSRGDFTSDDEFAEAEGYGTAEYPGMEASSDWNGGVYSVEDADAETRYVGGEMAPATRRPGGEMAPAAQYVGGEVRPRRTALNNAADRAALVDDSSSDDQALNDTAGRRLHELFDGGFDLRRAVIEAEILTPKYISKY